MYGKGTKQLGKTCGNVLLIWGKDKKHLLKRENMWKRRSYLCKKDKTEKRERKMWRHLAYVRKRDKTIAEKGKHVETSCLRGKEKLL